jgi:hypothetical protein
MEKIGLKGWMTTSPFYNPYAWTQLAKPDWLYKYDNVVGYDSPKTGAWGKYEHTKLSPLVDPMRTIEI